MNTETIIKNQEQHTLLRSIALHILPGVLTTLGFVAIKPLLDSNGFPPLFAFLLAVLFIDLPVMWGIMWFVGWKKNGKPGLNQVVLYRNKVNVKTFFLVFIGIFVLAYGLITLAAPMTEILRTGLFSWLPGWLNLDEQSQYTLFSRTILVIVFSVQLVLTGVVLPWTEELYFRGYLLPRISRFGKWAPLIGGLLFGLYHIWQPFGIVSVFLLGTLLGYVVWWKRDIRISISLHIVANSITRLVFLLVALSM